MLAILDKLLSKLPGNGKKSILGFILMYLPVVLPGFPVGEIDNLINIAGQALLSIGLIHKAIKDMRK